MKKITAHTLMLTVLMLVSILFFNSNSILAVSTSISITQDTTISNNTTWDVNNVYVKGNITIPANVTLTIAAGTNVVFNSSAGHYQINVTNGCIKALGTKLLPITFTVSSSAGYTDYTTNTGSWKGFYISNASNVADSLEFTYCNFYYTKTNSSLSYKAAFQITDCANINFQNCVFNNNLRSMNISNSKVYISSSQFLNSFYYSLIASIAEGTYKTYSKDFLVSNSTLHMNNCIVTGSCYRTIEANTSSVVKLYNNNFTYQPKASETYTVTGWDHAIIYSDLSKIYSLKDTFISNTQKLQHALFIRYSSKCEIDSAYFNNFYEYTIRYISSSGFVKNSTVTGTSFYAIGIASDFVNITNCTLSGNGNGMYIRQLAHSEICGCTLSNNGRGILIEQAEVIIQNSKIVNSTNNRAIHASTANLELINCLLANNSSGAEGSALYLDGSSVKIVNSTITYNKDGNNTGAPIYFLNTSGNIYNTIIWNNQLSNATAKQVYIVGDKHPSFYNSDVEGTQSQFTVTSGSYTGTYSNNINSDPLFADVSALTPGNSGGTALSKDFSLQSGSTCINGGVILPEMPQKDLANNIRVKFGYADIGAYENTISIITAPSIISSNTYWAADTIKIMDTVKVANTAFLKIAPGTVVLFQGDYSIICRGLFQAKGTYESPILFTRIDTANFYKTNSRLGGWTGLYIGPFHSEKLEENTTTYAYTETDTTEISYCIFKHCKPAIMNNLLRGVIRVTRRDKLKITHNIIDKCNLAVTGGTSTQGACIALHYGRNAQISFNEISNCTMNDGYITYTDFYDYSILNNKIHDNKGRLLMFASSSNYRIFNNEFYNNNITLSLLQVPYSNADLQNNIFYNNKCTTLIYVKDVSSCIFANNTVANNNNSEYIIYGKNINILNNILYGNTTKSIYLTSNSLVKNCILSPGSTINSGFSFVDCIFQNPKFSKSTISTNIINPIPIDVNWQFTISSPCINMGNTEGYFPKNIDFAGLNRQNGIIDIGAYEHQGKIPSFTLQPKGINLCEGNTILLSVAATDSAIYQWIKDGNELTGQNDDTLVIANASPSDMGMFRCKASNLFGTSNSEAVQVNVGSVPEILSSPESKFVTIGKPINVEVPVTGSKPLDISWYKNAVLLPLLKKAVLTTPAFAIGDEGVYKMKVTNVCGADSTPEFALYAEPKISFTTGIKGFCIGNRNAIKLSKGFSGTITWYRNGSLVVSENNDSLVVEKLSKDHEGSYYCMVSNAYGTVTTNQLYLVSSEAPAFTRQPLSQWVGSDGSVTLEVASTGSNPILYKWYRDGQLIDGENSIRYLIGGFAEANEKTYHCEVSNLCGNDVSTNAVLKLSPVIKTLTATGEPVVCQGGKFVLKVVFNDTASFQWFKDGVSLSKGKQRILAIDSVSAKHSGNYSCRVSNANGYEILGPVFLTVAQGATVEALPKITYVNESLQSTIEAYAGGDEPLTYKWYKNGIVLDNKTQSSLVLEKITKADEALYKCKVENVCNPIETNETRLVIAPQICMVGNLNQLNNKNVIIWDRNSGNSYEHYNIYRESSVKNKFDKIGNVPYAAITTFTDSAVNPKTQAFMYKITAVDKDGLETDINATAPHKTIHLLVTQGIPEGIQLDWDDYIGFDYGTYDIFRSIDKAGFVKVYSMSSTSRTYTDTKAVNTKDLRYYISVSRSAPCSADKLSQKAGAGPFAAAVSNMEDNSRIKFTATNVDMVDNNGFEAYPNPFTNHSNLKYKLDQTTDVRIVVTDFAGKEIATIIKSTQIPGIYNYEFGGDLQEGVYFLKISMGNHSKTVKILKIR